MAGSKRKLALRTGVGILAASSLLLSACNINKTFEWDSHSDIEEGNSAPAKDFPKDLAKYYEQDFSWGNCPKDLESAGENVSCATFKVPKTYEDLSQGDLKITALRYARDESTTRQLLVNPGGPGGSAVDFVSENAKLLFPSKILDEFAIVGMDSRGTKWSTPVKCVSDAEIDRLNAENSPDIFTTEGLKKVQDQMGWLGKKCLEHDDTIKWVDTVSTARDMDVLRYLSGQNKLDYLGYSYGTHLGAQYADLFPNKVGRMVLDGAVDPTIPFGELSNLQMQGFAKSLEHFVDWCHAEKEDCFLADGREGVEQIMGFAKQLKTHPLQVGNRKLTESLAISAIFGAMYSTNWYSTLYAALDAAMRSGNGGVMLKMSDLINDRLADGSYKSNQQVAFLAIHNLDYPLNGDAQAWKKQAEEMRDSDPLFAPYFAGAEAGRIEWPVKPVKKALKPLSAKGAPPILVIGTTHDPATPLVMAQNLAKQLDSGVLLTDEGWNHTAYSAAASQCIVNTVDDYLLDGVVPMSGKTCK
ncbi:alpha/beta hydrolase [Actinomycetaceae bacterium TAE3-ERU4]|nr:alpha/beta hydrolase [Actinomycetaceae bacterium TAE3-ERU4]